MTSSRIAFFVTLLLLCSSACGRKSVQTLHRKGVMVDTKSVSVSVGSHYNRKIQIQYSGCGGLFIRNGTRAIMIDPFFSNQHLLKLGGSMIGLGKIHSKARMIDFAQKRLLDSMQISADLLRDQTKAIFAAHGHYDHLMDIPYVQQRWLAKQADVYVNESSYYTCLKVIGDNKLHNIESVMSVREQEGQSIEIAGDDGTLMRVYPILAAHNPHSNHIKAFSGAVLRPVESYNEPDDKTSAQSWLEGRTLSFLIDIESNGQILFRMFVQSSSCSFPDGMPPQTLLNKKAVDLAVLGVASYHFSETTYPCSYLDKLKPTSLMFIHWEDFFRSYKKKPKSVMKTDVPRFFSAILSQCKPTGYIMPAPGVVVNVAY